MLFARENEFNKGFLDAALALGLPVSLLKGIAAMESAFNPKAFRDEPQIKDASRGLMQILDRTARGEGFKGKPEDLFDPATNIMWGGKYLAGLVKRHADLSAAVASYNMGHPRKASATTPTIERIYGKPGPEWIYANQPYVDRVLAYTAYYQTFERPDEKRRAIILDLIKKKIIETPRGMLHNPLFPSFKETIKAE